MRKVNFIGLLVLLMFSFTLFGCPPLGVKATSPTRDEVGVPDGAIPIWVQFSDIIDLSTVPGTMTVVDQNNVKLNGQTAYIPNQDGREDTIFFVYTGGSKLKPGTKYTVNVKNVITSRDKSKAMLGDYYYSFTTDGLLVSETYPVAGATDFTAGNPITVIFDNRIDTETARDAITVQEANTGAVVAGVTYPVTSPDPFRAIMFSQYGTGLRFKVNTKYKVTVKAGIKSVDGTLEMGTDYIFYFYTAQ